MWLVTAQIVWYVVISLVAAHDDTRYECGSHGRFEYCIDGNPSCVIGCHCYPGYYFDTDTKICEPNIKLIAQYGRKTYDIPSSALETPITTTASNKVEISNKDAEDIGDWLYNQFFKTIENQVINNSTNTPKLTRRKGGDVPMFDNEIPVENTKTRRSRKKQSKKQKKQEDLRRKLLRISEDDSLFRETKESSSSESDDSYSDESEEESKSKHYTVSPSKDDHSDDNHDVKEIIAFNKAPKPQLPPFVFLPGMDTPFFARPGPAPGLLPPLMSMFPMGPIPQMMFPPPMPFGAAPIPLPGVPGVPCNNSNTTPTPGSTTSATTESPAPPPPPPPPPLASRSGPSVQRVHHNGNPFNHRHRLKMPIRKTGLYQNRDYSAVDPVDNIYTNAIPNIDDDPAAMNGPPPPIEVKPQDFNYLSELIHPDKRLGGTATKSSPSQVQQNLQDTFNTVQNHIIHANNKHKQLAPSSLLSGRRSYYERDDTYYAKLGREIASLIRSINPEADDEIGTPSEDIIHKLPEVKKDDRYGSKSYWERAVRSPLHKTNFTIYYNSNMQKTNDDLYEIENKAKYAATTLPPFNLVQLENIIKILSHPKENQNFIIKTNEKKVTNIVHDILIEDQNGEMLNIKVNDSQTPEKFGGLLIHSANVLPLATITREPVRPTQSPIIIETTTKHIFVTKPNIKIYTNTPLTVRKQINVQPKNISEIVHSVIPQNNSSHDEIDSIWEHLKRNKQSSLTFKNHKNFHRHQSHLVQNPRILRSQKIVLKTTTSTSTTTTQSPKPKIKKSKMSLPFKYFHNSYFEHFE